MRTGILRLLIWPNKDVSRANFPGIANFKGKCRSKKIGSLQHILLLLARIVQEERKRKKYTDLKAKTSSATTTLKKPHASKKKATRRVDIPPVRKLKATIPSPIVVSEQGKED